MDPRFTVGTLLSRTFSVWGKNFGPIALLALVVYSPLLLWVLLVGPAEGLGPGGGLQNLFSSFLSFVLTGAVTFLVLRQFAGERIGFGKALAATAERFFAIFTTSFLGGLAALLGFVLLVVPGFVVLTMIFVAVPVAVVERPGASASLRRSADLTRGYRWHVFGAAVVLFLLVAVAAGAVGAATELAATGRAGALIGEAVGALAGSIPAVASAVAYHDLRVLKEGVDAASLVRVFE